MIRHSNSASIQQDIDQTYFRRTVDNFTLNHLKLMLLFWWNLCYKKDTVLVHVIHKQQIPSCFPHLIDGSSTVQYRTEVVHH